MRAFLCLEKPRSINNKDPRKSERFREVVWRAYRKAYPEDDAFWGNTYGIVYYFHRQDAHEQETTLDADNLSKPIWDALRGAAFTDDRYLKLRLAGIIDRDDRELSGIDLSAVPDELLDQLLRAFNNDVKHVLYIEFGPLEKQMFKFGLCELV